MNRIQEDILMVQGFLSLRGAPYKRLVQRVIFGAGTPSSVSYRKEILCREEIRPTRPPIYLPGQLDRVTGATEHQLLEAEIASMLAAEYKHAATIAYHIKDAVLFDGSVYAQNLRYFIADQALFTTGGEPRHLKVAGLASTTVGTRYFGHWLGDDCIQYLLAEQAGAVLCVSNSTTEHKRRYAAYFAQDWATTSRVLIDDLIIYQDYGQNSLKQRRHAALTELILSRFPKKKRDKLIYLRRGQTGFSRLVEEEPALMEILTSHGFRIVDVASDDLDQILGALCEAKLVVSIEGSHVMHCCYTLQRGSGLVLLQPSDRFTAIHRHWTDCVDVELGFVVGAFGKSGYQFESNEILKTVDHVLDQIERQ